MSWRTVYISSQCNLSFKNNYLVVRGEAINQIHLSEIHTLIIDSVMCTITTYLLNELINHKIKVIFCNDEHNPNMELMAYFGSHDSSRKIIKELSWDSDIYEEIWSMIIKSKINKQSQLLKSMNKQNADKLQMYQNDVVTGDKTNREGHAAKVYFNSLFGNDFCRDDETNVINSYLNYGYTILLSMFNREIINSGYITQIGIHHKGPKNPFNLSCDLMEPFRPLIDGYVIKNIKDSFEVSDKQELIKFLNGKITYLGKSVYISQAINLYVRKVIDSIENGIIENTWFEYDV